MLLDGERLQPRARPHGLAGRGVARTFQTVRLLPDLDVRENIQLGAAAAPRRTRARRPWAPSRATVAGGREAIERTGLTGLETASRPSCPTAPSAGSRSPGRWRCDPRLLLLDEPTAGMNQSERAEIAALLQQLRGEGLASCSSSTTCR